MKSLHLTYYQLNLQLNQLVIVVRLDLLVVIHEDLFVYTNLIKLKWYVLKNLKILGKHLKT
ncbi:Uncharacterised protein [Mycobacteroides abscessus]|nr:Uncharacterised protein [Mycobacteroides abscessus]